MEFIKQKIRILFRLITTVMHCNCYLALNQSNCQCQCSFQIIVIVLAPSSSPAGSWNQSAHPCLLTETAGGDQPRLAAETGVDPRVWLMTYCSPVY